MQRLLCMNALCQGTASLKIGTWKQENWQHINQSKPRNAHQGSSVYCSWFGPQSWPGRRQHIACNECVCIVLSWMQKHAGKKQENCTTVREEMAQVISMGALHDHEGITSRQLRKERCCKSAATLQKESAEKAQEGCRKAYDKLAQVWRPGHETLCLPAGLQSHCSLSLTASEITTCNHRWQVFLSFVATVKSLQC